MLILALAMLVAVVRVVPSAWMAPLKVVATVYTDVFRGTPTLLIVLLIGFGVPTLGLQGTPTSPFWLGVIALTLSYGAYVAEVIRAGILSVHPSQWASGRALGLTLRQDPPVRRPPAGAEAGDAAAAQRLRLAAEGHRAAVGDRGSRGAAPANIYSSRDFVFTPMVVAAVFFIAATIPLARFTDWLSLRAARRQNGAA